MSRSFFSSLLIASLFLVPGISFAMTNDEALQRITALLAQVQVLQAQLQQIGNTNQGPVVPVTTPTSVLLIQGGTACVLITTELGQGSRGSEVESLQRFLTTTGHYTYGEVTGYYGSATTQAVQRWQAQKGIVSSGTPDTTGYGAVGPKTRASFRSGCTGATTNEAVARDLVVTPEVGQLPLQVTATFSLNGSSCSSYLLDWGDGTQPLSYDAGPGTACTRDIAHKRATHTYRTPGVHRVTFRAGHGALSQVRAVSETYVSVGDTAPSVFSLTPTIGSAPLTTSVTFPVYSSTCTSYEVIWGDGTTDRFQPSNFTSCAQDSGTQALSHTYLTSGNYTVQIKTGRAPIAELSINEQWSVVVTDDITTAASVEVTPTSGSAPLIVNVRMAGRGESCTSYWLDWGDSSAIQQYSAPLQSCESDTLYQKTFTHTYIAPGVYTVKTRVGANALSLLPLNTQPITVGAPVTTPTVSTCSYGDTPVCGTAVFTCPAGYSCSQVPQTFSNRCALEDAGATFVHTGSCN